MPVPARTGWVTTPGEIHVTVRNVDALRRNFFEFSEEVDAGLRELARVYGEAIEEETYRTTYVGKEVDPPWHPGYMRDHIHLRFTPSGLGFTVGWDEADTDAIGENFYFKFWQLTGWTDRRGVFHPPVPSLHPAYELIRPHYQQAVARMLSTLARRHSAK
jgi:hypothetical protein